MTTPESKKASIADSLASKNSPFQLVPEIDDDAAIPRIQILPMTIHKDLQSRILAEQQCIQAKVAVSSCIQQAFQQDCKTFDDNSYASKLASGARIPLSKLDVQCLLGDAG